MAGNRGKLTEPKECGFPECDRKNLHVEHALQVLTAYAPDLLKEASWQE